MSDEERANLARLAAGGDLDAALRLVELIRRERSACEVCLDTGTPVPGARSVVEVEPGLYVVQGSRSIFAPREARFCRCARGQEDAKLDAERRRTARRAQVEEAAAFLATAANVLCGCGHPGRRHGDDPAYERGVDVCLECPYCDSFAPTDVTEEQSAEAERASARATLAHRIRERLRRVLPWAGAS